MDRNCYISIARYTDVRHKRQERVKSPRRVQAAFRPVLSFFFERCYLVGHFHVVHSLRPRVGDVTSVMCSRALMR